MSDPAGRVALVVVHGIADQRPGQTVREVAGLLCHGADGAPPYAQAEIQDLLIPVEKLAPREEKDEPEAPRQRPGTPSGFYQAEKTEAPRDLGLALNDYLLGRLELPEGDALYESTRIALRRRADDRPVDLYEMYWADLSRLGAGGLRALTALYQLFFHLGTLAADVVDQVALTMKGGAGWRWLQRLHAWMAWLMKGPTALLQLCMLLMVGFGALALVAPELRGQLIAALFGVGAVVLAALGALAWLRAAPGPARALKLFLLVAAAIASGAAALVVLLDFTLVPRMYFGAGVLGVALVGTYFVERYARVAEGTRLLGHALVAASVVALVLFAAHVRPGMSTLPEWMITAGLNVGELLLGGVLLAWAAFVAVQIVALLLGLWLGRACDAAGKASLHTARLTLVGSTALFGVLTLVLWSVVSFVAGRAVPRDILYTPVLFGGGYRSVEIFLESRVQTLGSFFTPLVLAFTVLVGTLLLVLLPSLLEEMSPTRNLDAQGVKKAAAAWAERLGNWLAGGIRLLGAAFRPLIPAGAIAGSVLYLAFVAEQFAFSMGVGGELVAVIAGWLEIFQGETLVAAGKWLAGGAVTLAALGSRFTQTFGRLRVAIDAVLDIDNYFADPPDRQPPRGRIFSRYASLLAYLRERGYARIVIVAHSQGTVISADLLRYLQTQGRLTALLGARPVALVTLGSPLRDLYAARFPLLYRWVSPRGTAFAEAAPAAAALGASEWVNACRSGDYVGRFLWTPDSEPARFAVAALDADGRVQARRAGDRTEFCLGAGAHTHYFSHDAVALAVELDRLIAGSAVVLPNHAAA